MGHTEVSSQSLRRTLKQLQAQNPQTETSRLEEEYLVRHTHLTTPCKFWFIGKNYENVGVYAILPPKVIFMQALVCAFAKFSMFAYE